MRRKQRTTTPGKRTGQQITEAHRTQRIRLLQTDPDEYFRRLTSLSYLKDEDDQPDRLVNTLEEQIGKILDAANRGVGIDAGEQAQNIARILRYRGLAD